MQNLLALIPFLQTVDVSGNTDALIVDATNDSRRVQPGWLFVAIKGAKFDAHTCIADAVANGAAGVIGEREVASVQAHLGTVPYIRVANARRAFAIVTHAVLDNPTQGIRIIGVTGTNGKTTCATILEQIFQGIGRNVGFIGTTGIRYAGIEQTQAYTTPHARALCDAIISMKQAGVDTVCMEVSSHALHQDRVHGIMFQGAVFTNLSRDHLDYHETMDAYAQAKQRLFDELTPQAIAVVHADDAYASAMLSSCRARITLRVGTTDDANVVVDDVECTKRGSTFQLRMPHAQGALRFATPLLGRFNVINAALCAAYAIQSGVDGADVVRILRSVRGPAGRMQRHTLVSGAVAVIDYAHTPDALEKALLAMREIVGTGRLHVVFGCGGDRDAGKRPIMGRVASEHADVLWLTSDNPRSEDPQAIIDAICQGVTHGHCCVEQHIDRAEAIRRALVDARAGDVVVIAGKGHETYQIIGTEERRFSDTEQVLTWNAAHRHGGTARD